MKLSRDNAYQGYIHVSGRLVVSRYRNFLLDGLTEDHPQVDRYLGIIHAKNEEEARVKFIERAGNYE